MIKTTIKIENIKTSFTQKELNVLYMLSLGSTVNDISEMLGTPRQTLYNTLRSALVKLRVRSYPKAISKCQRLGLFSECG